MRAARCVLYFLGEEPCREAKRVYFNLGIVVRDFQSQLRNPAWGEEAGRAAERV